MHVGAPSENAKSNAGPHPGAEHHRHERLDRLQRNQKRGPAGNRHRRTDLANCSKDLLGS